ncbi:hypothetical protein Y032_0011g1545 [Ancylostoma ceylanicum]|uniref:Uncharacterized protein n=1 Tax=Ancylostoma ceylanicum TaxID=53326 RepID=A0A016VH64_9BILA|nr:hypothetical protein Y032_0011g1545 [Ancylostoma ceylanicum]
MPDTAAFVEHPDTLSTQTRSKTAGTQIRYSSALAAHTVRFTNLAYWTRFKKSAPLDITKKDNTVSRRFDAPSRQKKPV